MKVFFVSLLLTLLSTGARAQGWEFMAGAGTRSLPFGAAAFGEIARSQLLWGQPSGVLYGFWRPVFRLQSSALVNVGEFRFEVAPISLLQIDVSYTASHRNTDLATLNCETLDCGGWLWRSGVGVRAVGGWSSLFLIGTLRWEELSLASGKGSFGDEQSNLQGRASGDQLLSSSAAIGVSLDPRNRMGVLASQQIMRSTSHQNLTVLGFWNHRWKPTWVLRLFAGTYESETQAQAGTVGLQLRWEPTGSLGF